MQQSDLELCRAVVEQGPDALIFADREGTIKLWNARAEALYVKSGGHALATRAAHKHGSKLYVELAFGIICDPQQGVLGAVATGRDITQRYLAERAERAQIALSHGDSD